MSKWGVVSEIVFSRVGAIGPIGTAPDALAGSVEPITREMVRCINFAAMSLYGAGILQFLLREAFRAK